MPKNNKAIIVNPVPESSQEAHVVIQVKGEDCRVEAMMQSGVLTVYVYPGHVGIGEDDFEDPLAVWSSDEQPSPAQVFTRRDGKFRMQEITDRELARTIRAMIVI